MQQIEMLYGPCDGTMFRPRPGQTTVRAFDGTHVYVYEPDGDGFFVHVETYPAPHLADIGARAWTTA